MQLRPDGEQGADSLVTEPRPQYEGGMTVNMRPTSIHPPACLTRRRAAFVVSGGCQYRLAETSYGLVVDMYMGRVYGICMNTTTAHNDVDFGPVDCPSCGTRQPQSMLDMFDRVTCVTCAGASVYDERPYIHSEQATA